MKTLNEAYEELFGDPPIAMKPTSEDLLKNTFQKKTSPAFFDLLKPEDFGTSINPNWRQRVAQRAAATEVRRAERDFARLGKAEEWERFVEQNGRVGATGWWNSTMETAVQPVFDLVSVGNYTTAGLFQEALRTGSVWEGFKQAAKEFGNALPGIEIEGARKPSFIDVFNEAGISKWGAYSAGLLADLVLDPMNLVPGAAVAKMTKMLGGKAIARSGQAGKAFDFLFTTNPELKKLGSAGEATLEHSSRAAGRLDRDLVRLLDKADELWANMTPVERRLFALWSGDRKKLNMTLNYSVRAGIVDPKTIPAMKKRMEAVKEWTDGWFMEMENAGLLDKSMYNDRYVRGMQVLDKGARREQEKIVRERALRKSSGQPITTPINPPTQGGTTNPLPSPAQIASFQKAKKYNTVGDRLEATLTGELRDTWGNPITTETDLAQILRKGTEEDLRALITRQFVSAVIGDGRVSARVAGDAKLWAKPEKWDNYKEALRAGAPGYDVIEVKRRVMTKKGVQDVVNGAWVVPQPVAAYVNKAEEVLRRPSDMEKLLDVLDKGMSFWRGWATFGSGYLSRNYMTGLFINWMKGVGSSSPAGKGTWIEKANIQLPRGKFLVRHLQAASIQAKIEGLGEIPRWMRWAADRAGISKIEPPKIVVGGKTLSVEDIYSKAQEYGVIQSATHAMDTPDELVKSVWVDMDSKLRSRVDRSKLDWVTKEALKQSSGNTLTKSIVRQLGPEGTVIQYHRTAAQVMEGNLRLAMFIDGLEKGADFAEAAGATKMWHIDYRNLTNTERRGFRNLLPFYTWQRFMVPRMVMATLENPGRVAKMPKIEGAIERLSAEWKEAPQPDYFDEVRMLQLPFVRNDKPLYAQLDLPILELNKLNKDDVLSSLNPMIKRVFETVPAGGISFFTGEEEEKFPGELSDELPFMTRSMENTLTSFFPPLGKFVTRPLKARKQGTMFEQVVSELAGIRLRALDTRRVLRAQTFEKRKLARLFRERLEQEMTRGVGE